MDGGTVAQERPCPTMPSRLCPLPWKRSMWHHPPRLRGRIACRPVQTPTVTCSRVQVHLAVRSAPHPHPYRTSQARAQRWGPRMPPHNLYDAKGSHSAALARRRPAQRGRDPFPCSCGERRGGGSHLPARGRGNTLAGPPPLPLSPINTGCPSWREVTGPVTPSMRGVT